jgi:hypothetical protein
MAAIHPRTLRRVACGLACTTAEAKRSMPLAVGYRQTVARTEMHLRMLGRIQLEHRSRQGPRP